MDPHFLPDSRLERDGILMKSGLTPTDMMVLKGDFPQYESAAASTALQCLCANIRETPEQIPGSGLRTCNETYVYQSGAHYFAATVSEAEILFPERRFVPDAGLLL